LTRFTALILYLSAFSCGSVPVSATCTDYRLLSAWILAGSTDD
jgi:hypothetical protein